MIFLKHFYGFIPCIKFIIINGLNIFNIRICIYRKKYQNQQIYVKSCDFNCEPLNDMSGVFDVTTRLFEYFLNLNYWSLGIQNKGLVNKNSQDTHTNG